MAVELAALITQLRADLVEAMRTGAGSELRFELGLVELELAGALGKSGGSPARCGSGWSSAGPTGAPPRPPSTRAAPTNREAGRS
ncbi:trypco2 family protein [Amycolatopsis sp. NPDC059090]|uniref:trypco2 family protein n=1 Tax=Amycolatopsis sp. NPDC059090 TaxID=3346723 RepID=UPI00367344E3